MTRPEVTPRSLPLPELMDDIFLDDGKNILYKKIILFLIYMYIMALPAYSLPLGPDIFLMCY